MDFKRQWDSSCPRVWVSWQTDGITWTIQDMPPEADELAVEMLLEQFVPDEIMCITSGITEDPEGKEALAYYWTSVLDKRTSLACYAEQDGIKTLVGLNICIVITGKEDQEEDYPKSEAFEHLMGTILYVKSKLDPNEYLGLDEVLHAKGLLVDRKYRGSGLGAKILAAREPLCRFLGIKGTATVFTGVASQKCAEKCGFTTIVDVPFTELADAGFKYEREPNRSLKLMVKKFE